MRLGAGKVAVIQPSIADLRMEIVERVQLCADLQGKVFKVFNILDLEDLLDSVVALPAAGVVYEGTAPKENSVTSATSKRTSAATLVTRSFMVIVGASYRRVQDGDGQLATTEGLLELILPTLLGYVGVNSRPWRFVGETAMDSPLEGAIFFGQMWETDVLLTSDI